MYPKQFEELRMNGYIDYEEGVVREAESLAILIPTNMREVSEDETKKALNDVIKEYRKAGMLHLAMV